MNTLEGSLNCRICEGERELPAWYVNQEEQTVRFYYDVCSCTGRTSHRPGEKRVSEQEYNRLKLLWVKPQQPRDDSFQVAA